MSKFTRREALKSSLFGLAVIASKAAFGTETVRKAIGGPMVEPAFVDLVGPDNDLASALGLEAEEAPLLFHGVVSDRRSGDPLGLCRVTLSHSHANSADLSPDSARLIPHLAVAQTVTDARGRFAFRTVAPKTQLVRGFTRYPHLHLQFDRPGWRKSACNLYLEHPLIVESDPILAAQLASGANVLFNRPVLTRLGNGDVVQAMRQDTTMNQLVDFEFSS